MKLDDFVNREQVLELALFFLMKHDTGDTICDPAMSVVIWYIMGDFDAEGRESFSEEEITDRINGLVSDYTLSHMTRDGYLETDIDDDGEVVYKLTEVGKEYAEAIKDYYGE